MAGPPRDCRTSAMARPARFRYAQSQRLMRTPRSLTTAHAAGRRLAAKIMLASATSCSSMSRRRCNGSPRTYEPVKVQAVEATKIGGVQGSLETDRSSNGTFSTATGGGELAEALGVVDALAADQRTRGPSFNASMRQPSYFSRRSSQGVETTYRRAWIAWEPRATAQGQYP